MLTKIVQEFDEEWFTFFKVPQELGTLEDLYYLVCRNPTDSYNYLNVPLSSLIIIWRKGWKEKDYHFKCEGVSPMGNFAEGVDVTPSGCLENLFSWFEFLDKDLV